MPTTRWQLRPVEDEAAVAALARDLNDLPPALARALMLRGVRSFDDARAFFRPTLDALHDARAMCGMDRAAERLAHAARSGERVLVYGDYDVDGTTATALMTSFLRSVGADATYFVPNRFEHGYGLSAAGLDHATAAGATLVVALDCGITAHEPARYAKGLGLDLVICDHHKPEAEIPDALAVLDPKQPTCAYPFKELTGCGLGFKLAGATLAALGRDPEEALPLLDLVAASTAADIVPLVGENRVLMTNGLARLRTAPRPGLAALARIASLDLATASTEGIVFGLGPRINAAGRLGDAGKAVDLLLAETADEAERLAFELEAFNKQRRDLDQDIQKTANGMADAQLADWAKHSVALYHPEWHLGVIGIVASRLVERHHRPAVMMCNAGPLVKGSARSVGGISIYKALQACSGLLEGFGGHEFAAGLTLRPENVPAFQRAFDEAVGEAAAADATTPVTDLDADVHLDEIGGRFWAVLRQFAPHGPDNLAPIFRAEGLDVVGSPRTVGKEGQHLKLYVRQRDGREVHEVIGYRMAKHLPDVLAAARSGRPLALAFSVEESTFRGNRSLQLKARDLAAEA